MMRLRPLIPLLLLFSCFIHAGAQPRRVSPKIITSLPKASFIPTSDTVRIYLLGDVMMHSRQLEYDYHAFLQHMAPTMQSADLCIANMEFPLAGKPYTGYPAFSTPDGYAEYLADCGTDVFLLGNNHVLDRGDAGLVRTLEVYDGIKERRGVEYTGAAADTSAYARLNPLILRRKGIKIAIINFSYGSNYGASGRWPALFRMDRKEVGEAFRKARESGADFILALPHWGEEYRLLHNASQEDWARWMVREGAGAVVGSHPHVVQDTTSIYGVPVIYSLGNAISNMSAINTRLELAVTLTVVKDRTTGEVTLLKPDLDFLWCTLPGMLTDNYSTISIKEWTTRRDEWSTVSDFDNMLETLARVKRVTGIGY